MASVEARGVEFLLPPSAREDFGMPVRAAFIQRPGGQRHRAHRRRSHLSDRPLPVAARLSERTLLTLFLIPVTILAVAGIVANAILPDAHRRGAGR